MASTKRILSFDIGIKNLAYSVTEGSTVHAVENCSIIDLPKQATCSRCGCTASFEHDTNIPTCKRHIPSSFPFLFKAVPKVAELAELCRKHGCLPEKRTKEGYCMELRKKFSMPLKQAKADVGANCIDTFHNGIRSFIKDRWHLFSTCTHVLIENQPAFKNPKMKTIQILLYASLREQFIRSSETHAKAAAAPSFHLVHAKKKVQGAPKGDAGYAERKRGSEIRICTLIDSGKLNFSAHANKNWTETKKKSDMADTLCMCVDFENEAKTHV